MKIVHRMRPLIPPIVLRVSSPGRDRTRPACPCDFARDLWEAAVGVALVFKTVIEDSRLMHFSMTLTYQACAGPYF